MINHRMVYCLFGSILMLLPSKGFAAEISLPNIFSDHMVLQRDQANPVWGKAKAGETVTVSIAGQEHRTTADGTGHWRVQLKPMAASSDPKTLKIAGHGTQISYQDVLVGEVWFCSGQSNMGWNVASSNDATMEMASTRYPNLRLLRVPILGAAEPQDDFEGGWVHCSPETVGSFSVTGYFFGRRVHQTLGIPVGLVNNAWGGSPIESWILRGALDATGKYEKKLSVWDKRYAEYSDEVRAKEIAEFEAWEKVGKPGARRWGPTDIRTGRHRPSNIWNAMVHSTVGYGMRGIIWCQGDFRFTGCSWPITIMKHMSRKKVAGRRYGKLRR